MIKIRRMTIDDLSLGLRLTRQEGWNHTESDWQRFMNMEPEGCFVAEMDGCPAGTTMTCILDGAAWIAMVLVDKDLRGRGIGTQLLKHAIDHLKKGNVRTVRLDATPAGRPIYEKLGFVPEYELARFEGRSQRTEDRSQKSVIRLPTSDVRRQTSSLIEFDRRMTGINRKKMLSRLFKEFPEAVRFVRRGNQVQGYVTARPGANALQVGPCVAAASEGPLLLSDALSRYAGELVFVDVPLDNRGAVRLVEATHLTVQRYFTRMCLGEQIQDNIQAIWASSGPEKG